MRLRISGVVRLLLHCAFNERMTGMLAGQRYLIVYGAPVGSFKITFERSKSVPQFRNIVMSLRHVHYRVILQNRIFTNTEQKYMMLLPFEKGMFVVS